MWLQIISLAAAISAVHGMCFGAPLLQQSMACPEPLVYNPELCICLEPKHVDRLQDGGSIRKAPFLTNSYIDAAQTFKNKLDALRLRMTASLPDMASHGHGPSLGDVRVPLVIFPDGYFMPRSTLATIQNHVPRTWRIGGLLESWANDPLHAGEIPVVSTGNTAPTSGWGLPSMEDLSALSLMERLHNMRNLWRDASQSQAERGLGHTALAQEFSKHLPTTGISPDTSRSYHHFDAGTPDASGGLYDSKLSKSQKPVDMTPELSMKEAALIKKELSEILPKNTARRTNSFMRSAMRLQSATGN